VSRLQSACGQVFRNSPSVCGHRNRLRPMSLEWDQVVVDAAQPAALGLWWANALGWVVTFEADDEYEIRPTPDRLPGLVFVPVLDSKVTKNRLHLDFRPITKRPRWTACWRWAPTGWTSVRGSSLGSCSPIRRATSFASLHLARVSDDHGVGR
jgi:hypothetical protein